MSTFQSCYLPPDAIEDAERVQRVKPGPCAWCDEYDADTERYVYSSMYRGQWHYSPAYCSPECHDEACES